MIQRSLDFSGSLSAEWNDSRWPALAAFGGLLLVLAMAGMGVMFKSAKVRQGGRQK
jgi:hypothetical protein